MMSVLGQSIARVDARAKVTGEAKYPGDVDIPGQLWMKVLFANRPYARIKRLDTSKALQAPGVVAIFTAKDVPVNEYGLNVHDNPVLCGPDALADTEHFSREAQTIVRWIGDKVALVVAETERQAQHARDLIEVEYEDLPAVFDPREAMKAGAPQLHEAYAENILQRYRVRKGDVDKAFAEADVIVKDTYHTPMQEHAYLQPEAGIGYIDDEGRVTVLVAGQWTWEDQHQIAHALNLHHDHVRVIYPAIGGAFGGREDMSIQIILALAAWKLRRPVKIIWSREESIQYHAKRHQMFFRAKTGAKKDGTLVAAWVEAIADAGAYAYTSSKVLFNTTLTCTGPYRIPNVSVDAYAVYTNNVPQAAFRGFGAPQGHFVAESQMNKLAEKLGMDPLELRLKNLLVDGDELSTRAPLAGGKVSLIEVTKACAERFGWNDKPQGDGNGWGVESHLKRGRGIASGFKNIGFSIGFQEHCWAGVELRGGGEIEEAIVYHAGADCGQGAHTVFLQMAATALDLPMERVRLVASDTAVTGSSGSASASRLTTMASRAIVGAAEMALEKWRNEERPAKAEYHWLAPPTEMIDAEDGHGQPNFLYGYVAQAVEVEVDTETGQVRVVRVTSAHDVGKAVNPQLIEGQVEGGVMQALGYTITENFVTKEGRVLTPYLNNYLMPGVLDIPEKVDSVILEFPSEIGAWGIRGMAEMPYIPFAAAVIAAVHDATGVWFNEFPLVPWKVLEGLKGSR
ncbi:MAG TPA: xanthine dehydrogenase family protein molybdopterin-binding subunit [Anaerolineae bacterium]|nr:xanthine dehydrogenase family protein molybdopterin-binding subunit [Anaerolineae bacterium]